MHLGVKSLRLAVRGDDFGLHPACDRVMLRLAEAGQLLNLSVQANGPNLQSSAPALARLQSNRVCVGLHLTLTCEWITPVLQPIKPLKHLPKLMQGGRLALDAQGVLDRQVPDREILAEADAQLQRVHELGLKPNYADVHMGLHRACPRLHRTISDWAVDRGLRWIDDLPRLPAQGSSLTNRFDQARARGGACLLVLHPGGLPAGSDLVLHADPNLDVGQERGAEAALAQAVYAAATQSPSVTLFRLDDMPQGKGVV
ncbi:MAG: ChbG/HpnK family deacetylase [Planctomycetota bacterium]